MATTEIEWKQRFEQERAARLSAQKALQVRERELAGARKMLAKSLSNSDHQISQRTAEPQSVVDQLRREIELRQAAEKELISSRDNAIELSDLKTQFLAGMSHEIRTPLNAIIGFTSLLLESKLSDRQRKQLSSVKSSGILLLRLINDILDLSKIEADKIDLEYATDNLENLVKQSIGLLMIEAERKGINFELSKQRGLPVNVMLDSSRVQQLILNLLSNSVKYSNKGTVRLQVSVVSLDLSDSQLPPALLESAPAEAHSRGVVEVSVTDQGIGIKPENIEFLFDPFTQFEGSKPGSTGLGLAICKRLCDLMQGEIHVQSEYGKGSTFVIRFPCFIIEEEREIVPLENVSPRPVAAPVNLANEPVDDLEDTHETDKLVSSSETGFWLMNGFDKDQIDESSKIAHEKPLSILLADDHKVNRMVQQAQLEQLGYRADCVANGEEVIRALFSRHYDVVLMDVSMPVMDGVECTQRIRQDKKSHQPFIAAVTASSLAHDKERFKEAGMNAYISKPVDIDKLASVLNQAHERIAQGRPQVTGDVPVQSEVNFNKVYKSLGPAADRLLLSVIPVYLRELPAREAGLRNTFGAGDADGFTKICHGLKGSLASIGADNLSALFGHYEAMGYDKKLPTVKQMDELLVYSAHTATLLRDKLASLDVQATA